MGQPLQQFTRGVIRADGLGEGAEDGAGVQPFFEEERDGPGDVISGDDGALHRCGTAPGGQQREVQVDPAVPGNIQGGARNQAAVGHDGGDIRRDGGDPCRDPSVHLRGMDHFNAQFSGTGGNGRRRQHAFASDRRIRTGQDSDDVKAGLHQGVQGRDRDCRRSGKEYPHSAAPKLPPPKLDPTVFARLDVVCSVMAS